MENNWEHTNLAALSSDVSYGYTESATEEIVGPKFLRITDIQNGVVDWRTVPYCPIDKKKHEKYKLHKGDIVVARTGSSTGENFLFNSDSDAVYASYLIRFQIDHKKANPRFVWYTMRSPDWWSYVQSSKTGSAQAGANAKVLGGYPINLPPFPEQKAIAHILGSLDDKIELNRRMNETLEAMAQALFKSWFIDFDPVIDNALAAGNAIPEELKERAETRAALGDARKPLPEETQNLFPSEFERASPSGRGWGEGANGLGWIPRWWRVGTAEQVADISIGKTPPRKENYWFSDMHSSNVIWVSIKDMGNCGAFIGDSSEYLTPNAMEEFNIKKVPEGSVLVSFKLTVGRVAIAKTDLTTNEAIAHFVSPKMGLTSEYLYCYLKSFNYQSLGSTSSIAIAVNSKIIKAMPIVIPSEKVSAIFYDAVNSYFMKINSIISHTIKLSDTRDTLLPKLLSGEMRLPAASIAELAAQAGISEAGKLVEDTKQMMKDEL